MLFYVSIYFCYLQLFIFIMFFNWQLFLFITIIINKRPYIQHIYIWRFVKLIWPIGKEVHWRQKSYRLDQVVHRAGCDNRRLWLVRNGRRTTILLTLFLWHFCNVQVPSLSLTSSASSCWEFLSSPWSSPSASTARKVLSVSGTWILLPGASNPVSLSLALDRLLRCMAV